MFGLARLSISVSIAVFLVFPPDAHAQMPPTPPGIRSLLDGVTESGISNVSPVRAFYEARGFTPAWSEVNLHAALGVLAQADQDGLDPADYIVPVASSPAQRDIRITAAVLSYLHDLRLGRDNLKALDADVELPEQVFDAPVMLASALKTQDLASALVAQAPPQPDYARLKGALSLYRNIVSRGGWGTLPEGRPADFAPGAFGEGSLRHRLQYEDPKLTESGTDLTDAVIRFQTRHGLTPDGRVGLKTLAELNVPAATRLMQIVSNMERWRWLPRSFEPSFITINVPDAHLTLTLDGRQVLDSVVVVGRPHDPTPILRAEGAGITVNPPWNVPTSIARREILPKLKANPSYLLSQDMILVNGPPGDPHGLHVNWRAIPSGTFPYRIQQHPGAKNSLGTIKVELPNRFDVYLHDTPAKGAFALPARDISHGCVRVQQILPLASYALAASLGAINTISNDVAAGQTKYLPLQRHLPVYFLYWTVFGAMDSTLQFRPDIYGRDQRLIAALGAPAAQRISANLVKCTRG